MPDSQGREVRAELIGALVPGHSWNGSVVSIYSKAINLLHPDGFLVGVVAFERQMSPFSIHAPELFTVGSDDIAVGLQQGTPCRWGGNRLELGPFGIELEEAISWSGLLPGALTGAVRKPQAILDLLLEGLRVAGAHDGLRELVIPNDSPTIFGRKAREVLDRTRSRSSSPDGTIRGLSGLIGLGIGFTPSGDDFISGVLLAEELTGGLGGLVDREEIRSTLKKTNNGGRTLLVSVLARQFPDYLLALARGLCEAAGRDADGDAAAGKTAIATVRTAAAHGETSGTDAMSGVAWYLERALSGLFI